MAIRPTFTSQYDAELAQINPQITQTEQSLSQFQNPTGYLDLLGKVASASYNSNADTIAFREAARRELYGEQGFKPENYAQLAPSQQEQIRSGSRAGLTAAIQASQETEAARGTRIENLLQTEGGRYKDTRDSLTDTLNRYTSRRSELEQSKKQAQSEGRQMFFDLVKNYPDLVNNLTPEEQNKLFQGNPDDKLMQKVGMFAKEQEAKNRVQSFEKNGYIVSYDPVTGKIISKVDTGIRDYHPGSTAGKTEEELLRAKLPDGYDFKLQVPRPGFAGGGVDFFGPNGPITREEFTNATRINWQEAAQAIGSQNPQDYAGSTTGQRLTAEDRAQAQSQAYNYLSAAQDAEELNTLAQQLLADPQNQAYFAEINAALNSIRQLKDF